MRRSWRMRDRHPTVNLNLVKVCAQRVLLVFCWLLWPCFSASVHPAYEPSVREKHSPVLVLVLQNSKSLWWGSESSLYISAFIYIQKCHHFPSRCGVTKIQNENRYLLWSYLNDIKWYDMWYIFVSEDWKWFYVKTWWYFVVVVH